MNEHQSSNPVYQRRLMVHRVGIFMSFAAMAVGIAFFFVPLSYLTMAYIPREGMNTASAVFNLLRTLGGSFGVAFVTTLLARRAGAAP